jgi:hypothetical protein
MKVDIQGADGDIEGRPDDGPDDEEFLDPAEADIEVVLDADAEGEEVDEQEESADGEQQDDPDDLQDYGKKVRKRIQREQDLKQKERAARVKAEEENALLRQRLADVEANAAASTIATRLEAAQEKLKQARYDADINAETDALAELSAVIDERAKAAARKKQEPASDPQREAKANELIDGWMKDHDWFDKPEFAAQKAATLAINAQLSREGFDDTEPEFYAELTKRVRDSVKLPSRPKPPRTVLSRSTEGRQPTPRGRVIITAEDKATMRGFNLDPNNKAHLLAFAKEKALEQ